MADIGVKDVLVSKLFITLFVETHIRLKRMLQAEKMAQLMSEHIFITFLIYPNTFFSVKWINIVGKISPASPTVFLSQQILPTQSVSDQERQVPIGFGTGIIVKMVVHKLIELGHAFELHVREVHAIQGLFSFDGITEFETWFGGKLPLCFVYPGNNHLSFKIGITCLLGPIDKMQVELELIKILLGKSQSGKQKQKQQAE